MFIEFEKLSSQAKVWVYPSSKKFYPQEIDGLKEKLQQFITDWKADAESFSASYTLLYNRFVVFAVEENTAITNQDMDKQVAFILQLQQEYEIELLDKMNVCFKQGEHVQYKELKEFKKLLKNKAVSSKTVVFDNLIQTKEELDNYWEVPITESWYSRFIK